MFSNQPAADARAGVVPDRLPPRLGKDFLHDVFRIGRQGHDPAGEREHDVDVAIVELRHRPEIALGDPLNDSLIRPPLA